MEELEIISNGYSEMELAGKMRKLTKLTLGDWADLEAFKKEERRKDVAEYKKKMLETAKELYPDGVPDSVFDKIVAKPPEENLDDGLDDASTMNFLLWCSLKKYNPGMTIEEAGALITFDNLAEITEVIIPVIEQKKTTDPPAKA